MEKIRANLRNLRTTKFYCLTVISERSTTRLTMTLKRWVLWLCIVALLAGEFFLFTANRQKDAALVSLREARQEIAQVQAQLDQLKSASLATQGTDNSRLRTDNQSLAQKLAQSQKEADQLRAVNQQLAQHLAAAREVLQQQQAQLQQLAADNQPATAAPPNEADRNACINNLRQIDAAKQMWALENDKTTAAVPTAQELQPYFKDGIFPVCPDGGAYTIGAVGEPPTCSIPGHVLPQ
jgi:septal ring factor EnvC (AmiA/AmiB activator)